MAEDESAPVSHEESTTPDPIGIPMVTSALDYPSIFADAVWFASAMNGTVRISFLENILEPQGISNPGWKARHVGTLVMPSMSFENMLDYLIQQRDFFRTLETAYLPTREKPGA
jgi:hypothetical protein